MKQGFRRGGMGGLPQDVISGASSRQPSRDIPGYDTTGTRLSQPGGGSALPIPADSPWANLIRLAFKAGRRQSTFLTTYAVCTNAAVVNVRPVEQRGYLLLQNRSSASILIGIGYSPTSANGLELSAGAVYEPFQVPDNEIFALGTVIAAQSLIVLFSIE